MRLIASTGNASYFTPWWKAGSALKNQLVAEGVSSDEFRSFPSGHTACAACAMLVALLPTVSKLFKGKEKRLGLLGCLWTAIVAFSRLRMGAHFLTDVTMAWLVTLGTQYYRTRVTDQQGRRVSLYARTREELYQKEQEAIQQIENKTYRRSTPILRI